MNWIEYRLKEARDRELPELELGLERWYIDRNADTLDGLTEFPRDILSLTHLTKLNLSGHALKELPPEIYKLKNLKELSVAQNQNLVAQFRGICSGVKSCYKAENLSCVFERIV